MPLQQRLSAIMAAQVVALALFAALPSTAFAAGPLQSGTIGPDISWPQCGANYPSGVAYGGYTFGIIGVTGGRPFTGNPCFATELAWGQGQRTSTSHLYINLDYGQSAGGPLICASTDAGCLAYNYGYDSAYWAYLYASRESGGAATRLDYWWLDVELGNYWSDDSDQNSYVIQGALDYFQRGIGKSAGVYSTPYQWSLIAGSFAPPNTPNWIAGASGLQDASLCSTPLWPGARVWAVQYLNYDLDLDQNLSC